MPVCQTTDGVAVSLSTKRIRTQDLTNGPTLEDIGSIDFNNAGKDSKDEYLQHMNLILADFLTNFPAQYEYCKSQIIAVRNLKAQGLESKEFNDVKAYRRSPHNFPDNSGISSSLAVLRAKAHELIAIFDGIQDWILAHIPTIKDEDNSGVEVQEAVVTQIAGYYKVIKGIYSEEMDYVSRRAELETSHLKQPASDSWMRAIILHDSQEWDDIENCWRALIRVIMLGQNLLIRNFEKLKEPRSKQRAMHI
uniref:Proteasome activator PA28 C-terminal domain-containing protein n=1 Tax=Paramoeba aestuarina TaxID=180227 RepID=A0A7S4KTU5_9EUKA